MPVRAIRGATTLDEDTPDEMSTRVVEMLEQIFETNDVGHDDLISILFTATPDLTAMFPAEAARALSLGDVPLMCATEIDVQGATRRCVRVLIHLESDRTVTQLRHVYLHGAMGLRDDLP